MFGKKKKQKDKVQEETPTINTGQEITPPKPPKEQPKKKLTQEEKELLKYFEQYRKYGIHTVEEFVMLTPADLERIRADDMFKIWLELRKLNENILKALEEEERGG